MQGIPRAAVLIVTLVLACGLGAQSVPPPEHQPQKVLERGTQIATAVSTITSTAVSPLLGVCVLGAYEYFHTNPEARGKLPLHTKPVFWIPVLVLLALILFKDSVGGAAPLLKKPLDAAEVLVLNKASLLLIGFPVVFHEVARILGLDSIVQLFALLGSAMDPVAFAQTAITQTAAAPDSMLHRSGEASAAFLMIALGMIATTAVWLVGHAMDVLLLLNPFPFVDLLLKGMRSALFAVLATLALLDPRVGMVLSGFVILISLLLAGWTFRLAVFGAMVSWDLLRTIVFRRFEQPREGEPVNAFAARRWNGIPKRGLVRVRLVQDQIDASYRPFLAGLPSRRGSPAAGFEVGRGLFYPVLMEKSSGKTVLWFLPRYRKQEERLAAVLGMGSVVDVRMGRGLQAFFKWLKDDDPAAADGTASETGTAK